VLISHWPLRATNYGRWYRWWLQSNRFHITYIVLEGTQNTAQSNPISQTAWWMMGLRSIALSCLSFRNSSSLHLNEFMDGTFTTIDEVCFIRWQSAEWRKTFEHSVGWQLVSVHDVTSQIMIAGCRLKQLIIVMPSFPVTTVRFI